MIHAILIPINLIGGVWCLYNAIEGVNVLINVIFAVLNIAAVGLNYYDAKEWMDNHE